MELLTAETWPKFSVTPEPPSDAAEATPAKLRRSDKRKYTFVMTQEYASCAVLTAHRDPVQAQFAAYERTKYEDRLHQIRRVPGRTEIDESTYVPQADVDRLKQPEYDPDIPKGPVEHFDALGSAIPGCEGECQLNKVQIIDNKCTNVKMAVFRNQKVAWQSHTSTGRKGDEIAHFSFVLDSVSKMAPAM